MTLRLNRRSEGGLVRYVPPKGQEWRNVLRSSAWRPRRRGLWERQTGVRWGVRSLDNPAHEPVTGRLGVLVLGALALATFVALVVLRLLGIWS